MGGKARGSFKRRAKGVGRPKRNARVIQFRGLGKIALQRKRLAWARHGDPDTGDAFEMEFLRRRFGREHSRAQLVLFDQCDLCNPSKKKVIRALMAGARFDRPSKFEGLSAFLLSAIKGETEKRWLWDLAVSAGVDIQKVDSERRGFELWAACGGCEAAMLWWAERGGRLNRVDQADRDIWSHAAQSGSKALECLLRIENDERKVQAAIYGLPKVFDQINQKSEAETGYRKAVKGSALSILIYGPALNELSHFLQARSWLVKPSHELSDFFDTQAVDAQALLRLRRLEEGAIARQQADEIRAATSSGKRSAAKGL